MLLQLLLLAATSAGATAAVKTVGAAAAPDATSILGVNVHSDTPDLDLIEAAGLRWVRMDMAWQLLEPRVGVYDFAATDPFFKQLAARKMGVISILGDWNPLYSAGPEEVGPHLTNASSIAAFARFGRAVAARYSRDGVLFELINEPNTGGGYKNASLYAEVALAAGGAIRSAGGKVAAPALAGPDAAWLQVTLDAGLLSVVDTVTLHPYRSTAPETAAVTYKRIRSLLSRYERIDQPSVVLSQGEVGYGRGNSSSADPITATMQAKLAARMFLTSIASGVAPAIWYDWRTPNASICDVPNSECMGLVTGTGTLTKTPAYFAVQALARQLQGLAFVAAQPVCVSDPCQPSSSDFSISLMNATHSAIVVWSTLSFPHNVQLLFAAGCYDAADWMGQPLPQLCAKTSYNTHLNVMVEDSPVYLTQLTKPKHELKTIKSDDGADLMTATQRAWLLAAARVPKPDAATWPPMSAAQDAQLLTAVEAFGTDYMKHHLLGTPTLVQNADPVYRSHHLAAMAFKYNATKDAAALRFVHTALRTIDNLTSATPKEGFLARVMCPTSNVACMAYACRSWPVYNTSYCYKAIFNATTPGYIYLDSLSRDQYLGVALGLVSTLTHVDDAEAQSSAADILRKMATLLVKEYFWELSP